MINKQAKMEKIIHNQKVIRIISTLRPWAIMILLIVIMRFTGILSGVSYVTQTAIMKTGMMDFDPYAETKKEIPFNYDFSIKDLNGNIISMSEFKNKTVFINLWATWCGPCRAEMQSIQNLYDQVDHDKIMFVMLSLDKDAQHNKIVDYIGNKKFTFPVYQPSGYLTDQLNVPSIPTTFIIGPDGKIKSKKVGAANYDTEKFKKFLEEVRIEKP
jgi:thiol-disulfide isomerase/thioredoxin